MEKEVEPVVLSVINEKRLLGEKLTPVEIIAKMGVFDARTQASSSAWLASGDNVIATLWAELVNVAANGRWFYLESLDVHRRPGGGDRSPMQVQRARDRLQLLKFSLDEGQGIRTVLQTNRVEIMEAESDKMAKVSVRTPDDAEWHVADWNPEEKLAILVRGERGWLPSEDEIEIARIRCGVPTARDRAGAALSREDLHAAAVDYLVKHFAGYGYRTENVSSEHFGYDLDVSDKKGKTLLKLAVKGLGAGTPSFKITPAERAGAQDGDPWRLAVVSDAGTPQAAHKVYKPTELEDMPGLEPEI